MTVASIIKGENQAVPKGYQQPSADCYQTFPPTPREEASMGETHNTRTGEIIQDYCDAIAG